MAEAITFQDDAEQHTADIIDLFSPDIRRPLTVPRATGAELAEYRRLWPLMVQMLKEWEIVKGSGGCPIARRLTD